MPGLEKLKSMKAHEFMEYVCKHEKVADVKDGIYDATGVEYIKVDSPEEALDWIEARDEFWAVNVFGANVCFLFDGAPKKFEGDWDKAAILAAEQLTPPKGRITICRT